jgi:hypothetical protein
MTRRKRLSADLPQHWLHDPVFWQLTDRAWRLYTHALMWAIGRTDGEIPSQMLSSLLPGSDEDRDLAVKELVSARLWECTPDGWRISELGRAPIDHRADQQPACLPGPQEGSAARPRTGHLT